MSDLQHHRNRPPGTNSVSETIMNKTSGGVDNWRDPNPDEPYSDPELDRRNAKGSNWRYDGEGGLSFESKFSACELRGEILDHGAINGCAIGVDIDRVKVKALGQEMNHYFLMRRPWKGKVPAGHAEPRWKIEFKWMSITIFTMVVTWEDLERLR